MRAAKLFSFCVLALSALPLTAQTWPAAGLSTPRAGLPALQAPDSALIDEVLASRFLFFALTPELAAGTPEALGFRIDLNGQPFLEETLDLRQVPDAQSAAFEILATRPDLRDRLYELGRKRSNRLTVQVVVDGAVVHEFASFGELLRYNRALKRSFRPAAAPSEVRDLTGTEAPATSQDPLAPLFTKGVYPEQWCADQCSEQYDACSCDYGDCSRCHAQWEGCLSSCPTYCVEPKSVTSTNKTDIIGITYGPSECRELPWENDFRYGEWYQSVTYQFKHYTLRRTESCNGTVTNEELNVSYSSRNCLSRTYGTCSYPWTWASNVC
jgi:hypothetical protein